MVGMSEEMLPGLGLLPDSGTQEALFSAAPVPSPVEGECADPVAHVLVLAPQPHLARVFDYQVPAKLAEDAVPGARVVVPLASREVEGFIVSRDSLTGQASELRPLKRVVSPVPVLSPSMLSFAEQIAREYGTCITNVLRLAIPQRHARAEREFFGAEPARPARTRAGFSTDLWDLYSGGPAFLSALAEGRPTRAVCCALSGQGGATTLLAAAVSAVLGRGESAILVSPTQRSATRLAEALERMLDEPVALMLSADASQDRYSSFLAALTGRRRVIVGTRLAVWTQVPDLGLIVVLDDAAPQLREERAPYCHARDIAMARARHEDASLLVFSPYVSEETRAWTQEGRALMVEGSANAVLAFTPRVSLAEQWRGGEGDANRIPTPVFTLVREALERGPVLIVVPRSGYLPRLACLRCREPAVCRLCGGALKLEHGNAAPRCARCGTRAEEHRCPSCGSPQLRPMRIGSERTAQDVARAFPGVGIIVSSGSAAEGIVSTVSSKPRLVIATPGAEPVAKGGYAAAVILDSRFLQGDGLGSETRLIRLVTRIASRVRPRREAGHLMLAGGADPGLVAAVGAWALGDFASLLLQERRHLRLPPTAAWFSITGTKEGIRHFLALARSELERAPIAPSGSEAEQDILLAGGVGTLSAGVETLGPVPAKRQNEITVYLRCEAPHRAALGERIGTAHRIHTASGEASLRIEYAPEMS